MRTIVITGVASGMGAATAARLTAAGHRVIGIDRDEADLGTPSGRAAALALVRDETDVLDGVVTCAGVAGRSFRAGSEVVSVNYFGTVELLEGLRPLLARGERPAAVAISSNATTRQPGIPMDVYEHCLAGDEASARAAADAVGRFAYGASKLAVARWVRRHAPTDEWAGAGVTLNAIAPGVVETAMYAEARRDPELVGLLGRQVIPVGRPGTADDVAALVCFLLGPDARFFCGSILFLDGGQDAADAPDAWPRPLR